MARARQCVGERGCLPVLLQRSARHRKSRLLPGRVLRRQRGPPASCRLTSPRRFQPKEPDKASMRLVTYTLGSSGARLGVLVDGLIVDVERLGASRDLAWPSDMLSFIDNSVTLLPALKDCLEGANGRFPSGSAVPVEDVKLQEPIPRPRKKLFGIGLNYRAHVAESAKSLDTDKNLPKQPVVFSKPPTSVIGPGGAIHHNAKMTQQLDWEVELAVIIGKTATRISVEKAMDHIFGYSVMIDISARDNRRAGQWIFSKGMDT